MKTEQQEQTIIRVVIADDHAVVRRSVRAMLRDCTDLVVVGEASTGVEAVRLVEELNPDVLLLDMEMPGFNGLQVAEQLQASHTDTRILVLSGYADRFFIQAVLERGAKGYLTKDEAPDLIIQAIRGVAQRQEGWLSQRARIALAV